MTRRLPTLLIDHHCAHSAGASRISSSIRHGLCYFSFSISALLCKTGSPILLPMPATRIVTTPQGVAAAEPPAENKSASASLASPVARSAPDTATILLQFVKMALRGKMVGDDRNYLKLLTALDSKLDDAGALRWYTALSNCVSGVSSDYYHRQLISVFLAFDWNKSREALEAYCGFVFNLVCTTGDFLVPFLNSLTKKLLLECVDVERQSVG